jgi:hypoxanthine phosphoribosyltransferase
MPEGYCRVASAPESAQITKEFISADSLLRDSLALGMQIVRSGFKPTFLVGVWRGGAPISIAVQEVLAFHGIECDLLPVRTCSYTSIGQQAAEVRVHGIDELVSRLSCEDRLLLIDDIFDSGRSLEALIAELSRRCRGNMPAHLRIATVYYKPARNRTKLVPDFYLRATDDWLVFPHELKGLTREEILSSKPVDHDFFRTE